MYLTKNNSIVKAKEHLMQELDKDVTFIRSVPTSLMLHNFNPDYYEKIISLNIYNKNNNRISRDIQKSGFRTSVVKISNGTAQKYGLVTNQIARIATVDCRKMYDCTVVIVPDEYNCNNDKTRLEDDEIQLLYFLREEFISQTQCLLIIPKSYKRSSINFQKARFIRGRYISFSTTLYESIKALNPAYIEIRHLATGATMLKPFSQVRPDASLNTNETTNSGLERKEAIRLTYYQRVILNLQNNYKEDIIYDKIDRACYNPEDYISVNKYDVKKIEKMGKNSLLYVKSKSAKSSQQLDTIKNGKIITDNEWHEHKISNVEKVQSQVCDHVISVIGKFHGKAIEVDIIQPNYKTVQIVPIYSFIKENNSPIKRIQIFLSTILSALKRSFFSFLVGDSNLCLSAVRPYQVDDDRDIVRLSHDNMTLLGINETDRVLIEYKGKKINATVMSIDSFEYIKEQNIVFSEADLDTIVGIPSPLRRKLGIHDIETEVFVYRDTEFVFKKNLNIQLLPILALIFTVFQINISLKLQVFICVVMTPLIMYSALSQERQKVKELNELKFYKPDREKKHKR